MAWSSHLEVNLRQWSLVLSPGGEPAAAEPGPQSPGDGVLVQSRDGIINQLKTEVLSLPSVPSFTPNL
ncbi:hypothetical protein VZT92_024031 [Zoarces viviparus]|uniref:Uncharacterized protein n=1 Tax=Zoarces viviparus TaxID=48416 RepID=A0AAW1E1H6_ZOAVI